MPRGLLRVGAASIVHHQLALLLRFGCQRVLCLAQGMLPELAAMQRLAETNGCRFHLVAGARGLLPLVTAADDVVVLDDGLLAAPDIAIPLLEAGNGVLSQPVEEGIAAGFERLDINRATAGAMRCPGSVVQALASLDADCGVGPALTRLALQAGVPLRPLPSEATKGFGWQLLTDQMSASIAEQRWLARLVADSAGLSLSEAIVRWLIRNFGSTILGNGNRRSYLGAAVATLLALSLATAWFGYTAPALLVLGLAWIAGRLALRLGALQNGVQAQPTGSRLASKVLPVMADAAFVAVCALATAELPSRWPGEPLFAPLLLVLILRLSSHDLPDRWRAAMSDRAHLAVVMAAASLGHMLSPVMQGVTLIVVMAALAVTHVAARRLTRA